MRLLLYQLAPNMQQIEGDIGEFTSNGWATVFVFSSQKPYAYFACFL